MEIEIKLQHPLNKEKGVECMAHPAKYQDEPCIAEWRLRIGHPENSWTGYTVDVCEYASNEWDILCDLYEKFRKEEVNDAIQLRVDEACGH